MRDFFQQIDAALRSNLYYVALLTSLAVPDICGALDSEDGLATREKYEAWFDRYVAPACFGVITGEDCYRFRCAMLHQGSSQHPAGRYSRVIFVEPQAAGGNILHCNILNDALNIDVRVFCLDILRGAFTWLDEVEQTQRYQRNYGRFMRRYPQGLPPYIVGVPVIS